jgi:hypothetical protein
MDGVHYEPLEVDDLIEVDYDDLDNDEPLEVDDKTQDDADNLEHPFAYQQRHPPLILHPPLSFNLPGITTSSGDFAQENSSE